VTRRQPGWEEHPPPIPHAHTRTHTRTHTRNHARPPRLVICDCCRLLVSVCAQVSQQARLTVPHRRRPLSTADLPADTLCGQQQPGCVCSECTEGRRLAGSAGCSMVQGRGRAKPKLRALLVSWQTPTPAAAAAAAAHLVLRHLLVIVFTPAALSGPCLALAVG
jgi:hypothetical protein